MDPRLKLIIKGNPNEELHLLLRLKNENQTPKYAKVIAQFGDIISCRILRKHLMMVYDDKATRSLKAPQVIPANRDFTTKSEERGFTNTTYKTLRVNKSKKSNVVFGIIDFGFDFTHPDFLDAHQQTRFEKIWVQAKKQDSPNKYNYGQIYDEKSINKALASSKPFEYLKYHPGVADFFGRGMHGTHVLGIAAASGNVGKKGFAGNSPIIAVDMGSNYVNGSDLSLGDSVKLVGGIDFILEQAGNRPCVINMSLGGHGDAHTGQTLVELAINNVLKSRKGLAIVQSTGNYFNAKCHHLSTIDEGEEQEIEWVFKKVDNTPNEMEIWYENEDELTVELYNEDGELLGESEAYKDAIFGVEGKKDGIIFHRAKEPNTGKNHINIIIAGKPISGSIIVKVIGKSIKNGRFHAYIERDDRGQSYFHPQDVNTNHTIGSICNAPLAITVGAYDQRNKNKYPMSFSSAGPTVDGRVKPEIVAPGSKIFAAKSASKFEAFASGKLTSKSGSSMAAPYVASLIVKILEEYPSINIYELRRYLFKYCKIYKSSSETIKNKTGYGAINTIGLIQDLIKKRNGDENNKKIQNSLLL